MTKNLSCTEHYILSILKTKFRKHYLRIESGGA